MRLALCILISSFVGVTAMASIPSSSEFIKKLNQDNDSTLELGEINAAANAHFNAADSKHTGRVPHKEISKLGLTRTDLARVHLDSQGALTRDDYLKLVDSQFTAADTDHDGSVDAAELESPWGRELRRLLQ